MVLGRDYKTSVGRSIFLFNLLRTFFNGTPSLWQYWSLWSFKLGATKTGRFLAKNKQGQRKLQYVLKCKIARLDIWAFNNKVCNFESIKVLFNKNKFNLIIKKTKFLFKIEKKRTFWKSLYTKNRPNSSWLGIIPSI